MRRNGPLVVLRIQFQISPLESSQEAIDASVNSCKIVQEMDSDLGVRSESEFSDFPVCLTTKLSRKPVGIDPSEKGGSPWLF